MNINTNVDSEVPAISERQHWSEPVVSDLPALTDLTLQSAAAPPSGDAITGTGSSSGLVF